MLFSLAENWLFLLQALLFGCKFFFKINFSEFLVIYKIHFVWIIHKLNSRSFWKDFHVNWAKMSIWLLKTSSAFRKNYVLFSFFTIITEVIRSKWLNYKLAYSKKALMWTLDLKREEISFMIAGKWTEDCKKLQETQNIYHLKNFIQERINHLFISSYFFLHSNKLQPQASN